ncbi:MAG: tRNA (adenosine(37)-N6)-threonylcarbamoyltransferase complex dimerization subunit type 1 TsaB [Jatrophihabitans sp.]|uniref:tRNA (adenosine(37)-N6)-threonylcarbamoyltransferase complex dimerization subunit type 1 TsaB n=1 Tax=Jatrophihabitans sp. TaxID=1932789 RepID=UPI003F8169BE
MLVLALDTSTAAISVALAEVSGGTVTPRAQRQEVNAKGHGELLSPTIAATLQDAGAAATDVGAIVAGIGPGPYTGLRVGLVTAAALGDALGVPTYGVCSLDGIRPTTEGDYLVLTDARRREVYWARYDAAGERTGGPDVAAPGAVPLDGLTAIAGAGARIYADVLAGPALLDADFPDPLVLVHRALDRLGSGAPGEALVPLYLRHPDAVVPGVPKTVTARP